MTSKQPVYKVEEDTVQGLARGYILNTNSLYKCNVKLEAIDNWTTTQKEILNDNGNRN